VLKRIEEKTERKGVRDEVIDKPALTKKKKRGNEKKDLRLAEKTN